jgi:hypothetical protein
MKEIHRNFNEEIISPSPSLGNRGRFSKLDEDATMSFDEPMTRETEVYTTIKIEKEAVPYSVPSSSKLLKQVSKVKKLKEEI